LKGKARKKIWLESLSAVAVEPMWLDNPQSSTFDGHPPPWSAAHHPFPPEIGCVNHSGLGFRSMVYGIGITVGFQVAPSRRGSF